MNRFSALWIFMLIAAAGVMFLVKPWAAKEQHRPQTPYPPYAYDVEDIEVTAPDGVALSGTLTIPVGNGPFPAAILLSVAGPNDRDQSYRGHKSFQVIADSLTKKGIATARFDDRGIGGSEGDYLSTSWEGLTIDAQTIKTTLASDHRINARQIGFIGMSEGGAIAAMAANKSADSAFVILLSAPGLPGRDALALQLEKTLELSKVTGERANVFRALFDEFMSIVTSDPGAPETKARLKTFLEGQGRTLIPPYGFMPKTIDGQISVFLGPWYQSNVRFEPRPVYGTLDTPVLAIGGSLDPIAPPQEHLEAIEDLLDAAPTNDYRVQSFDGLNHFLQEAQTGLPTEYARLSNTVSPAVLDLMGDWLEARLFNAEDLSRDSNEARRGEDATD